MTKELSSIRDTCIKQEDLNPKPQATFPHVGHNGTIEQFKLLGRILNQFLVEK